MRQRHLICENCGREQWAAGRVIEEAERKLSYRWCRPCLDEYGPLVAHVRPHGNREGMTNEPLDVVAEPDPQPVQGEAAGIEAFFGGLAQHLIAEVNGRNVRMTRDQVDPRMLRVGAGVSYHGSKVEDHGPARVRDASDQRTVLIVTETGKQIQCNWSSVSYSEPEPFRPPLPMVFDGDLLDLSEPPAPAPRLVLVPPALLNA